MTVLEVEWMLYFLYVKEIFKTGDKFRELIFLFFFSSSIVGNVVRCSVCAALPKTSRFLVMQQGAPFRSADLATRKYDTRLLWNSHRRQTPWTVDVCMMETASVQSYLFCSSSICYSNVCERERESAVLDSIFWKYLSLKSPSAVDTFETIIIKKRINATHKHTTI